jgi:2-iminobutanoate/2-iminopropanoate deaminase
VTELRVTTRQEYTVVGLPAAISHYADAVRFGDLLFVSGLTAHDENGRLVGKGDAASQTQQIFINMQKIFDAIGARFSDVLKVTVYLTDIGDREKINPIRKQFFGDTKPASTLVEVSKLALEGMKVEIEAIVGLNKGTLNGGT